MRYRALRDYIQKLATNFTKYEVISVCHDKVLKTGLRIGFFLVFMTLACVSLTGCSRSKAEAGGLIIESKKFNFGVLEQFTEWNRQFKISNTTSEPIQVLDIRSSCGCTSGQIEQSRITPGKSSNIDVTIDPQNRDGRYGYTLTVVWMGENSGIVNTSEFFLYGRVSPLFERSPSSFQFGDVRYGEKPLTQIVRISHSKSKTQWDDIRCSARYFTPVKNMASKDAYELTLELDPSKFPIGTVRDEVKLDLLFNGKKVQVPVDPTISVTARIIGDVKAVPESIYLGAMPNAGVREGEFNIQSSSDKPLKLLSITSSSPDTLSANLERQDSHSLSLKWKMEIGGTPGSIYQKFLIKVRSSSEYEIAVPVIGFLKNDPIIGLKPTDGK